MNRSDVCYITYITLRLLIYVLLKNTSYRLTSGTGELPPVQQRETGGVRLVQHPLHWGSAGRYSPLICLLFHFLKGKTLPVSTWCWPPHSSTSLLPWWSYRSSISGQVISKSRAMYLFAELVWHCGGTRWRDVTATAAIRRELVRLTGESGRLRGHQGEVLISPVQLYVWWYSFYFPRVVSTYVKNKML